MSFLRSTISDVAALVHHADVARLEEAVRRHRPSRSRPAAASSPPSPAGRGSRSRPAGRAARGWPASSRIAISVFGNGRPIVPLYSRAMDRIAGGDRRGLRQAVALDDRHAGELEPLLGDRLLHRHAAAVGDAQAREVELLELRRSRPARCTACSRPGCTLNLYFASSLTKPGMSRGLAISTLSAPRRMPPRQFTVSANTWYSGSAQM